MTLDRIEPVERKNPTDTQNTDAGGPQGKKRHYVLGESRGKRVEHVSINRLKPVTLAPTTSAIARTLENRNP